MTNTARYAIVASAVAVAMTSFSAGSALAVPVSYGIDTSQSSFELRVGGIPTGSTAPLSGSINADLTGGVLTFSGGSSIVTGNDFSFSGPIVIPTTLLTSTPAITATVTFTGTGSATYSNFAFDITGGSAGDGTDRSALSFKPTSGTVSSSASGSGVVSGTIIGVPFSFPFTASGTGSGSFASAASAPLQPGDAVDLTAIGTTETLTIPVLTASYITSVSLTTDFDAPGLPGEIASLLAPFLQGVLEGNAAELGAPSFSGPLVATRTVPEVVAAVPEPASLVLFGLGLAGLASIARRRVR
jgi:hypothetical protein